MRGGARGGPAPSGPAQAAGGALPPLQALPAPPTWSWSMEAGCSQDMCRGAPFWVPARCSLALDLGGLALPEWSSQRLFPAGGPQAAPPPSTHTHTHARARASHFVYRLVPRQN